MKMLKVNYNIDSLELYISNDFHIRKKKLSFKLHLLNEIIKYYQKKKIII
jgi:hypothetical protein